MLRTLCHQIGIAYPIFSVGMGPVAGPELAAAVSNAGGGGVLGGLFSPPLSLVGDPPAPHLDRQTVWGEPHSAAIAEGQIETAWQNGCRCWCSFGAIPALRRRGPPPGDEGLHPGRLRRGSHGRRCGRRSIIVQGIEAGGHEEPHRPVSPRTRGGRWLHLCLLSPPVLPLAEVWWQPSVWGPKRCPWGRSFSSTEACVTHAYQEWIVRSTAEDTVYTTLFDLGWPEAPHQVLRNTAFQEWEAAGRPASGQRPGRHRWYCLGGWHYHGGQNMERCHRSPASAGTWSLSPSRWGDRAVSANDITPPVAQIVHDVVREAEEVIAHKGR